MNTNIKKIATLGLLAALTATQCWGATSHPLNEAAQKGDVAAITTLLASGQDPTILDKDGMSPLMEAAKNGHEAAVTILLQNDNVKKGINTLSIENPENQQISLSALQLAAGAAHDTIVKILLKNGANPNTANKQKMTPLMVAVRGLGDFDNEADYNEADHIKVADRRTKIVEMLLKAGAKVDVTDEFGNTALLYSVQQNFNDQVVQILLDAHADVNKADQYGETPLLIAAFSGFPTILDILLKNKALVDSADKKGSTPLMYAAQTNNVQIVKILLKAGAKVSMVDKSGSTILIYAALSSAFNSGEIKNKIEIINLLLKAGAAINAADQDGNTPLIDAVQKANNMALINPTDQNDEHYAVLQGYDEIIHIFLNNKADTNLANKNGQTALDAALSAKTPNQEIIQALREAMAKNTEPVVSTSAASQPMSLAKSAQVTSTPAATQSSKQKKRRHKKNKSN